VEVVSQLLSAGAALDALDVVSAVTRASLNSL
jgi:hypothetical protein